MKFLALKGTKIISKTAQKSISGGGPGGNCIDNYACCMKMCIGSAGVDFCRDFICAI